MRLIIAGGRDFMNVPLLVQKLDVLCSRKMPDVVLCGEARGADALGKRWAQSKGIAVESYPADWDAHGKRAGFLRNKLMAENATHLVAFWDGKSKGTKHMIDYANAKGLKVRVVNY